MLSKNHSNHQVVIKSSDQATWDGSVMSEEYTPFILDYSKFSSLPDELLIEIFQYVGSNTFEMLTLSHVNREWKELLNSQFRIWQFVPLTISKSKQPTGSKDEIGHLLLKYFDRFSPVYYKNPKYQHVYKQFDVQYEKYIREKAIDNKIKESEVPKLLKAYKKPIIVSTDQFIDFIKHVKKEKASAERLRNTRAYFDSLTSTVEKWVIRGYLVLLVTILLDVCVSLGLFGSVPSEERSLDKGLWWLPYSFVPMHVLFIFTYSIITMFTVNECFKFKSRSEVGIMSVFYLAVSVLGWIFTSFKYGMYEKAGLELGNWQDAFYPRSNFFYLLPFMIISGIGIGVPFSELFSQHISKSNKFPFFTTHIPWATLDTYKIAVLVTFTLCELSLLLFSTLNNTLGPLVSLFPMIAGGVIGSIYAIKYNWHNSGWDSVFFSLMPICGSVALGSLAVESFNYWSFIPLTLAVSATVVDGLWRHQI